MHSSLISSLHSSLFQSLKTICNLQSASCFKEKRYVSCRKRDETSLSLQENPAVTGYANRSISKLCFSRKEASPPHTGFNTHVTR